MSLHALLATAGMAVLLAVAPADPAIAADTAAPSGSAEPSARALDLGRRYVRATGQERTARASTIVLTPMVTALLARKARPQLSDDQRTALAAAVDQAAEAAVPRQIESFARLYAETFTEAELEALLAVYEGPHGAAITDKMVRLSGTTTVLGLEHMVRVQTDALAAFCRDRPRQALCQPTEGDTRS